VTANWAGGNSHSHFGVHTKQTGLLQRYTSWFAKIHYCTTSTCSERCSQDWSNLSLLATTLQ